VVNIDGYSARESMYSFLTPSLWAWRATLASAMDVVATGARPVAAMASVGAPDDGFIWEVLNGVAWASLYAGMTPGKHDSNRSAPGGEWIDVAVLGVLGEAPIPRRPPRTRLLVVQAGYAGYGLVETRLQGRPPLGVPSWIAKRKPPVGAWRALSLCGAEAAMDNSDGYLYTLRTMALLGGLDIELRRPPLADPRLPVRGWEVLGSWEDYNLLVMVSPERAECLLGELRRARIPSAIVGEARPGRGRILAGGAPVDAGGYERWV